MNSVCQGDQEVAGVHMTLLARIEQSEGLRYNQSHQGTINPRETLKRTAAGKVQVPKAVPKNLKCPNLRL